MTNSHFNTERDSFSDGQRMNDFFILTKQVLRSSVGSLKFNSGNKEVPYERRRKKTRKKTQAAGRGL